MSKPTIAEKLVEMLTHAQDKLIEQGLDEGQLSFAGVEGDPAIYYLCVNEQSVFRAAAIPDTNEDGEKLVVFYGTWLGAGRDLLEEGELEKTPPGTGGWN